MRTLSFGLALVLVASVAGADIIHLENGNVVEGELQDLGNGKVRIRMDYGSLTLGQSQIRQVETSHTPEEIVRDAVAKLASDDAAGRYELALWARGEQSHTLARKLLREALKVDPEHDGARRALGYHRFGERWLTETELRAARGEVQFQGHWMRADERDRILAREAQIAAERREVAQEDRRRRVERAEERRREAEREARLERRQSSFGQVVGSFAAPFTYYAPLAPYRPVVVPFGSGYAYQTLPAFRPGQILVPGYNRSPYRFSLVNPNVGYAAALQRSRTYGYAGTSGVATRRY